MKALYELKDKLQDELDEIARKPEMGAGDLELVHKLTDTIKNIDKICALEEDGGYSEAGDYEGASYGRGSSLQIVENTMSGGTTPGTGVVAIAGMGAWVDTAATTPKRL